MDLVGYGVVDLGFEELDDIVDSVMMLWIYCEAGVACPKLVDSIEVVIKHWKDCQREGRRVWQLGAIDLRREKGEEEKVARDLWER